jgi:cysteine desulfurase/selenocysteine lyase
MPPTASIPTPPAAALDVEKVRRDFPILAERSGGHPLIYVDNAATTQKPRQVIDAESRYYGSQNANIHRGVYALSQLATRLYEETRVKAQRFLNAAEPAEIIFTRGTTEAINLVAHSYARAFLKPGDEVLVSALEHHSNIVPWQIACELTGAKLRVIPMNDAGELLMDEYAKLLNPRTKLVAVNHVSNALGTVNPIAEIIAQAHAVGAKVLIDGAQWVAHHATDVRRLDADFYAFSAHKLYGPTGVGVLYGKRVLLDAIPPYQSGGDMIASVTFEKTVYAELPNKFEAGTPNIAGGVALGAAIDYVLSIGFEKIAAHEAELLAYATAEFQKLPGVRIIGTARDKAAVISFVVEDPPLSSLDVGTRLDFEGVAVRTGHHCCQPIMDRFGIPATTRASFGLYNTKHDVDTLVAALRKILDKHREKAGSADLRAQIFVVKYPEAAAPTPAAAAEEIANLFEFLDDWQARYQQIIEFGEKLPPMPAAMKNEATRVHGCQSVVHLSARTKPGTRDTIEFLADSDADIVRGLIAILEKIYSGQRAADVAAFDIEGFLSRLGLDANLSMTRRNGLASMIKRLRAEAAALTAKFSS